MSDATDEPKFRLGHVVGTPGAMEALWAAGERSGDYFRRHACGDWGDVDAEDKAANEWSLANGARVLSAYTLKNGAKIWIITEADRASTCILLPEEY